ncbi:MAG: hypothetical protein ACQSGP_02135 [Frankia sp.]
MSDIISHHDEPCRLGCGPLAAPGGAAAVIASAARVDLTAAVEELAEMIRAYRDLHVRSFARYGLARPPLSEADAFAVLETATAGFHGLVRVLLATVPVYAFMAARRALRVVQREIEAAAGGGEGQW